MKQLNELKRIYKLDSKFLSAHKWDLQLSLETALRDFPDLVVTLNDSQILRWIDELNGIDYNARIAELKEEIRVNKQNTDTSKNKQKRKALYSELYNLQFQKDYVCVVMKSEKDYDRANQGFTINGIKYRRLLGTNGGIKNSTIVYINEDLYPEIKRRIDNGRNPDAELVPAKLEAYQALVCSGSTPIPAPKGVIVVDDCITHFTEDVITISNENVGEPILQYVNDYEIEHNNSDGFGLMLPEYSIKVNQYLTGEDETISGMVVRNAFTKGCLFTFSFDEFADEVAGSYEIKDVWGDCRDIRDADIILTSSMLKLWDSYSSWEDYYTNTINNHYDFAVTKIAPAALENKRSTNYQFLQSYELTDEEIAELCRPTITEIKDILGGDYRKSLVYLGGGSITAERFKHLDDDYIKALCLNPEMINDPYVKSMIYKNIEKRMERAKRGKIEIDGNYAIISGDPYALSQSMFGLPVTGILSPGELYHQYWNDRDVKEICCFRAPMSCHANIRKMKINNFDMARKWYRYIKTCIILNAWDSTFEASNGADADGDTFFTTNNPILLKNTRKEPTIICNQNKAEKKIPTESDLIAANKIAFNDEIGIITNRVTAMYEKRAKFAPDSDEYKVLTYRILCGQHYQQCQIDAAKGIISKPMPETWYKITDDMTDFEKSICVDKKPYFMIYVYPHEKARHKEYTENCNTNSIRKFGKQITELRAEANTDEEKEYLYYYDLLMPVGTSDCTMNRICYHFEQEFADVPKSVTYADDFDYSILKSGAAYSKQKYNSIKEIHKDYISRLKAFMKQSKTARIDKENVELNKMIMISDFARRCAIVAPNDAELTDILIDLLYTTKESKSFVWLMCGRQIIKNLLQKTNNTITIPVAADDGDFSVNGQTYTMIRKEVTQ